MTGEHFSISIHAPREGSDVADSANTLPSLLFLSTLPVRGATRAVLSTYQRGAISIHAPGVGGASAPHGRALPAADFYPRSP